MRSPLAVLLGVLATTTVAAATSTGAGCGSSTTSAQPDPGDGGDSAVSDGSGDVINGDAAADARPKPPVHAACASPVATVAPEISAIGEIARIAVAWSGTEAAVLYSAKKTTGVYNPYFVRLDRTGKALGAPVLVRDAWVTEDQPVAIVSDGASYIACWNESKTGPMTISCVSIAVGSSTPKTAFSEAAYAPRLAFDGINRAIYGSAGATAAMWLLDATGTKTGTPAYPSESFGFLAARWPGFVVATTQTIAGGGKELDWELFDTKGTREGTRQSMTILGELAALASVDENQVAINARSSDAFVLRIAIGATAAALDPGAFPTGNPSAALAPALASFGAAWARSADTTGKDVRYRALDATGTLLGTNLTLTGNGRGPVDMAAVDDGFLVVATQGGGFVAPGTAIVATHLACP